MDSSYHEIKMGPVGSRLTSGVVISATRTLAGIDVQFTHGSAMLLADWLRDNCLCHDCRIVQTDERRWRPWSQPAAPCSSGRGACLYLQSQR